VGQRLTRPRHDAPVAGHQVLLEGPGRFGQPPVEPFCGSGILRPVRRYG
jgi:hypothetical protein